MIMGNLAEFIVKIELFGEETGRPVTMISFYAQDGGYIGNVDGFKRLVDHWGILPEKAEAKDKVCSIGKSFKDGKWYGWSHRAICGFQIGDVVKEGDCCATSGLVESYLAEHPEENKALLIGFEAKTEEDCKKMAIAFADSVS
jgi:hypothetical protein